MKISVLLPVYNEARYIAACLESLRNQTVPPHDFEIIVMDGASTDDTRALVEQAKIWAGDRLRLLDNPRRTTAHALNIGLATARGDIIARIDGHSIVPPNYLAELRRTLTDAQVWGVGAAVVNADSSPRAKSVWAALCSRFGYWGSPYREPGAVRDVDTVQAAAYRREVFDQVGAFDTAMLTRRMTSLIIGFVPPAEESSFVGTLHSDTFHAPRIRDSQGRCTTTGAAGYGCLARLAAPCA